MEVLNHFKVNLKTFFDELIEMFPDEPQFVTTRILISDQIPITFIMDLFVKNILPIKDRIKKRDDRIFTEEGVMNFGMDTGDTDVFRRIWLSPSFGHQDRKAIWEWLDAFVMFAERYVKATTAA